jgi:hypothetical protein
VARPAVPGLKQQDGSPGSRMPGDLRQNLLHRFLTTPEIADDHEVT